MAPLIFLAIALLATSVAPKPCKVDYPPIYKDVVAIAYDEHNVEIASDGWNDLPDMTLKVILPKCMVMLIAKNMVRLSETTDGASKGVSHLAVRINDTDYAEVDMTTDLLGNGYQDSLITVYPRRLEAGSYVFKARWKASSQPFGKVKFTSIARSLIFIAWPIP